MVARLYMYPTDLQRFEEEALGGPRGSYPLHPDIKGCLVGGQMGGLVGGQRDGDFYKHSR